MHYTTTLKFLPLIISAFAIVETTVSDPDILSDFIVLPNVTIVDGNFFTSNALSDITNLKFQGFACKQGNISSSQEIKYVMFYRSTRTWEHTIPPHMHPRSSELTIVLKDSLQVGCVNTSNKLFTQTLQPGDLFVVPKGLVHFTHKAAKETAQALAAFGSANPGIVLITNNLFNTTINDCILASSFRTHVATIQALKKSLTSFIIK